MAGRISSDPSATAPVHVQRPRRHRTVDIDGQLGDAALGHQPIDVPQDDLGSVDGEGRNHNHTTTTRRLGYHLGQNVFGVDIGVLLVAIGRLDHDEVGAANRVRRQQQWVGRAAEISAEHHRRLMILELDAQACCTQNVPSVTPRGPDARH